MCGLAGTTNPLARDWVVFASAALAHRGPDGDGMWQEGDCDCDGDCPINSNTAVPLQNTALHTALRAGPKPGAILAHRRLATTDLRAVAAQPMHSENQRFVFVFNGYVAGHHRLRARLIKAGNIGRVAPSHSDTAVFLALLAQGLTSGEMPADDAGAMLSQQAQGPAFKRMAHILGDISGAYAFALWDRQQQALWLAVDMNGQKPLYVAERADGHVFFTSELGPLLSAPGISHQHDADAFDLSLAHLFVPAPKTAFRAIRQLRPGEVLCWQGGTLRGFQLSASMKGPQQRPMPEAEPAASPVIQDRIGYSPKSHDHNVKALRKRVYRAVADAMQCDRPVACLLSGGVDSAGIAALATRVARHRSRKSQGPSAIVMGFPGQPHDETARAQQLAQHLGMPLKIVPAPNQAEDILRRLKIALRAFGGPFSNPAVILAHCLAESVAEIAPVCLTGDGGDEVFGGYRRYRMAQCAEKWLKAPLPVRKAAAVGAHWGQAGVRCVAGGSALNGMGKFLQATAGQKTDIFAAWNRRCVLPGYGRLQDVLGDGGFDDDAQPLAMQMMQFDQRVTLAGNQLAISDRMGMAAGVEYRPPLLDPSVRALAASIPVREHMKGGGKAVWREVVSPLVPARYLAVEKSGFNPPIGLWLRDVSRLLWADETQAQDHLFAPVEIPPRQQRDIWQRALANEFDAALTVWNLLVWHVWQENQGEIFPGISIAGR